MGVERYIHIGPYIRVTYDKQLAKRDNCPANNDCINPDDAFCPRCGLEQSKRFSSYEKHPDFRGLYGDRLDESGDAVESECGTKNIISLVPNISGPRDFRGGADLDSEEFSIVGEQLWMQNEFSDEIVDLRKKFGNSRVEVRWGYFTWWY